MIPIFIRDSGISTRIESGGKPEIVMFAYNLDHFRLISIQFRRFAAFSFFISLFRSMSV